MISERVRSIVDEQGLKVAAVAAAKERLLRVERQKQAGRGGLIEFVRYFWREIEPDVSFQDGWAIQAMALHLEAVSAGAITRLLINISPGACKSLLVNCFWPLWEWSALNRPGLRYLSLSYSSDLTERDNRRMLMIIRSQRFQDLWGHRFKLDKEGEQLVTNDKTGVKMAAGIRGSVTGNRADRVILDDPNSVKDVESKTIREETSRFFREGIGNRLNDMTKSAIVVVQQRSHEADISGIIITEELPYEHLMIPLLYEPDRSAPTCIGWEDPRTEDGECFWPDRYPPEAVADAKAMGEFAFAGQYQQRPDPRGGGLFKREWWNLWALPEEKRDWTEDRLSPIEQLQKRNKYPLLDTIIASVDPAYTERQQNDPSALVILGVHYADDGEPMVLLVDAWQKRLAIHGPDIKREWGEDEDLYISRAKSHWGLVEWIGHSCKRFKVERLLVESRASGISVVQELNRLLYGKKFAIDLINPGKADKVVRANRVQHLFTAGMIWRPERRWAEAVEDEMAAFPRGRHDDYVDAITQGLWYLRQSGYLERRGERQAARQAASERPYNPRDDLPLYEV